jgi:hypothetical protein
MYTYQLCSTIHQCGVKSQPTGYHVSLTSYPGLVQGDEHLIDIAALRHHPVPRRLLGFAHAVPRQDSLDPISRAKQGFCALGLTHSLTLIADPSHAMDRACLQDAVSETLHSPAATSAAPAETLDGALATSSPRPAPPDSSHPESSPTNGPMLDNDPNGERAVHQAVQQAVHSPPDSVRGGTEPSALQAEGPDGKMPLPPLNGEAAAGRDNHRGGAVQAVQTAVHTSAEEQLASHGSVWDVQTPAQTADDKRLSSGGPVQAVQPPVPEEQTQGEEESMHRGAVHAVQLAAQAVQTSGEEQLTSSGVYPPSPDGAPPGLVPVLGAFMSADRRRLYVAHPRVPDNLANLLRFSPGALGDDGTKRLLLYQLLTALQAVHARGLWHGGLNPERVLMTDDR